MQADETSSSAPHRFRAPLLWLIAPVIAGYLTERAAPALPPLLPASAGVVLAIGSSLFAIGKDYLHRYWIACFVLGASLCAWGYSGYRNCPLPQRWQGLPPREAEFQLKVERLFGSARPDRPITGIAVIKQAAAHLKDLENRSIYFSLYRPTSLGSIIRSSRLHARGVVRVLPDRAKSDNFAAYLLEQGVQLELRRGTVLALETRGDTMQRALFNQAGRFERLLRLGSPGSPYQEIPDVYVAMILGKRSALSPATKSVFIETGTMHLFAISGLHVVAVSFTIHYFLLLLRVPRRLSIVIGLGAVFSYVHVTGAAPSATRAFLLVLCYSTALMLRRQPSTFSALVGSGLIVLLWQPLQLRNAGFQLSYSVVAAILIYAVPLARTLNARITLFADLPPNRVTRLHRWTQKACKWLMATVCVSFAATLASTPLIIEYFEVFTPGAIILNIALVPLASLLVCSGISSLLVGTAHLEFLSVFLNHASWVIIAVMNLLVGIGHSMPGYYWNLSFRWPHYGTVCIALLLFTMIVGRARVMRRWWVRYWLPPALLVLLLVVGATAATA